jgi:hypothetical protein
MSDAQIKQEGAQVRTERRARLQTLGRRRLEALGTARGRGRHAAPPASRPVRSSAIRSGRSARTQSGPPQTRRRRSAHSAQLEPQSSASGRGAASDRNPCALGVSTCASVLRSASGLSGGGRLELDGVFGGCPSFASYFAIRSRSSAFSASSAKISASFAAHQVSSGRAALSSRL